MSEAGKSKRPRARSKIVVLTLLSCIVLCLALIAYAATSSNISEEINFETDVNNSPQEQSENTGVETDITNDRTQESMENATLSTNSDNSTELLTENATLSTYTENSPKGLNPEITLTTGTSGENLTLFYITASAGDHGSINPEGLVSVAIGGNKLFAFTADENYRVSEVLVDDESVEAEENYTFTNVQANHTISVTFDPLGHTLTVQAKDKDNHNLPRAVKFKGTMGNGTAFEKTSDSNGKANITVSEGTASVNTWWDDHLTNATTIDITTNATLDVKTKVARLDKEGTNYYALASINNTAIGSVEFVVDAIKIKEVNGTGTISLKLDHANWDRTDEPKWIRINDLVYTPTTGGDANWTWTNSVLTVNIYIKTEGDVDTSFVPPTDPSNPTNPGGPGGLAIGGPGPAGTGTPGVPGGFSLTTALVELGVLQRGSSRQFKVTLTWSGVTEITIEEIQVSAADWVTSSEQLPKTCAKDVAAVNGSATLTFSLAVPEKADFGRQSVALTFRVSSGTLSATTSAPISFNVSQSAFLPAEQPVQALVAALLLGAVLLVVVSAVRRKRKRPY